MIILGVDPGTLITGYSVVEFEKRRFKVLTYDVIKNLSARTMPIRLKEIYDTLCTVIERFHPDEFAIETAFYGKNAQSALKLGHARGVAILAAVNFQLPTTEYSPREIKKVVTGNGAASKQQVQYMVKAQLKLRETPKFFDASDALAVAMCHAWQSSLPRAKEKTYSSSDKKRWQQFLNAHPERLVKKI